MSAIDRSFAALQQQQQPRQGLSVRVTRSIDLL
jgi:hypothetical protein